MTLVSAILTAAGESTRMGRPKALLPWHGTTLLEHQTACLIDAGAAEVVVVLGHQANAVVPQVKGPHVRHVLNPDYRLGKTTSIKPACEAQTQMLMPYYCSRWTSHAPRKSSRK